MRAALLLPRNLRLVPSYVDPDMTRSGREHDQPLAHHPVFRRSFFQLSPVHHERNNVQSLREIQQIL
jgi:hypothetical protein